MYCKDCGKPIKKTNMRGYCQACYNYYRHGGIVYAIPPKGVIVKDPTGKVICHICGKSFISLGGHVYNQHGLEVSKYREMFGLCTRAKITENTFSKKKHDSAFLHHMDEQLREAGRHTRFRTGNPPRKGKKSRLQENLEKSERMRKYYRKG